jgi:hypothetical protein
MAKRLKPAEALRTEQLVFRGTREERRQVEEMAVESGVTLSDLLRSIVQTAIKAASKQRAKP